MIGLLAGTFLLDHGVKLYAVTLRDPQGVVESYALWPGIGKTLQFVGRKTKQFPQGTRFIYNGIPVLSPDGTLFALLSESNERTSLEVLDVRTLSTSKRFDALGATAVTWFPDGRTLLLLNKGQSVTVISLDRNLKKEIIPKAKSVAWSRSGSTLFVNTETAWPLRSKAGSWTSYDFKSPPKRRSLTFVLNNSWLGSIPLKLRRDLCLSPASGWIWKRSGVFIPFVRSEDDGLISTDFFAGSSGFHQIKHHSNYSGIWSAAMFGDSQAAYVQSFKLFTDAEAKDKDLWLGFVNFDTFHREQRIVQNGTLVINPLHFAVSAIKF